MVPRTGLPMIIRTNTAPMSMPNGISTIRQPLRANFVQRPVVAPSPVVMSKRHMTVNIAPTGMRALVSSNRKLHGPLILNFCKIAFVCISYKVDLPRGQYNFLPRLTELLRGADSWRIFAWTKVTYVHKSSVLG